MSKIINIILEVVGFIMLISAITPSLFGNQTPTAVFGAVLVIYSLSRKVISKLNNDITKS